MTMETRVGLITHSIKQNKMGLYKKILPTHGGIKKNETTEGLPVEKMWAALKDNQSVGGLEGKELMYPQDGIPYGTDIRDSKWDKAIGETEKVTKAITAARERKSKQAADKRAEMLKKQAEERGEIATSKVAGKEGTASSE